LLEHNSLGFNVTDLLGDDLLGHFLQHEELLLNDLDAQRLADNLLLLDDNLGGDLSRKVVRSVEVVKARERGETSPRVKAGVTTVQALSLGVEGGCDGTAGERRDGKQRESDLGEHDCQSKSRW